MTRLPVLIAGSQGQVARALLRRAPPDLVDAVALGRPLLDLADPSSVTSAVVSRRPSLVINAAAYTAVDLAETNEAEAMAVNAHGAGMLAAAARSVGAAVIHLSTDYVFDGRSTEPYRETDPVGPLSAYGRSKLAGERAVAAATDDYLIVRTAWVYSAHGRNFVRTMLRLAAQRDTVTVVADQFGNPTYADDIAAAIWRIVAQLPHIPRGLYHMTSAGSASWAEFAEVIYAASARLDGPVARVQHIPSSDYPTPAPRPANSRLDCSRLAGLGISLPDWRASVYPCVAEILSQPGWSA